MAQMFSILFSCFISLQLGSHVCKECLHTVEFAAVSLWGSTIWPHPCSQFSVVSLLYVVLAVIVVSGACQETLSLLPSCSAAH